MEHNCEFITGFHMEPGEDGDPIFCEQPAAIKYNEQWFCADHYDLVEDYEATNAQSRWDSYETRPVCGRCNCEFDDQGKCNCDFYMGVDVGFDRDTTKVAVFAVLYDKMWFVLDKEYRS